jgi:ribose 5-phosphate isomerase B
MRVHIGSDHAAFEAKNDLVAWLESEGHTVVDHGPSFYDALDDYPVFCIRAAQGVAGDAGSLGIVLGGSGNGEQIAANKVAGVRAALAWSEETASLAREHNDANVVSVGARMHDVPTVRAIVGTFLATPFSEGDRHVRRIGMISAFETDGTLPPLPVQSD